MGKTRQTFSKEFKAKIALEALREESTIQQLSVKYSVHSNQIMQWKKFAIENLAELFERPNKKNQQQKESESIQGELLKTIGTQKIELDFLKKKYRQLYGSEPPALTVQAGS